MSNNTNVSQMGRGVLPLYFSGGSSALRFWAYNGAIGSSDGDNTLNQMIMPWNGQVRYAYIFTGADPGAIVVGVHLDRNVVATFSQSVTPSGAGVVTQVPLGGQFAAGQQLGFSVNPTNDPGAANMVIAVEYGSSVR